MWLESPDKGTRRRAIDTLERMGLSPALRAEALAIRLWHVDADVRTNAARALGEMGADAVPHAKELTDYINHQDPVIRKLVVQCLYEIGEVAAENAESVASMLRDDDKEVRVLAAGTLNRMGPAAHKHADWVATFLRHYDGSERAWAAESLGYMLKLGSNHGEQLVHTAISDSISFVRASAAAALARQGIPENIALLSLHLTSLSASTRKRAFEACGHLGEMNAPHVPELMRGIWDLDPGVRIQAAKALGSLGPALTPLAIELSEFLCFDVVPTNMRLAAAALRYMGRPGALALASKLNHEDTLISELARQTLQDMGEDFADLLE